MSYSTLPIVGAYFRPPAELILSSIPVGTKLFLLAEPENEHDINAVAVWIQTTEIPESAFSKLEIELPNFGLDIEQLCEQEFWHLGYIPRNFALMLRQNGVVNENENLAVTYALSADGRKPRVKFSSPVLG